MIEALLILHLIIAAAMVAVVLLQKSEGGALGIGGGGGGGFLTGRGTDNLLSRTTALLALAFFTTSILLSILPNMLRDAPQSRFTAPAASGSTTAPPAGAEGQAPQPGTGGVLDKLKSGQGGQRLPTIPQSQ